ncbi:MAG: hypothetical protein II892_08560 [Fibrobacter sp.]|jgi:hypothetical protein|nr:hypothetical protein [Fibrobacter sp.]
MLNFRINKLLFVLGLLFSLNAFAQKNDSLDVQNEDPVALLDSIDHYQKLIDKTEAKIENRSWGYLGIGLGSVSLVSGLYLLHGIAGAGGAGYAIGVGVIPAVLISGGLALTIAGGMALSTTSKLPEKVAEYKERKAFFTERYDEIKVKYVQDSSSVNMAYIELLNDDTFKSLKKKAQCREKANISDFYQCVGDLYSEASLWGFSLGGIFTTLGTAYVGSQKNFTASTAIMIPLIGYGVYFIVCGGIFNSKANEYRAKAGH